MNTTTAKCPTCGSVMRWYAGHSNGVQLRAEALEKCPECGTVLEFLETAPPQALDDGGIQVVVPMASAIYECSTHGRWRIYINGQYEKYGKPRANER